MATKVNRYRSKLVNMKEEVERIITDMDVDIEESSDEDEEEREQLVSSRPYIDQVFESLGQTIESLGGE